MADALVIVESPAKAKTIGKYLGSKLLLKLRWDIFGIYQRVRLALR